MIYYIRKCIYIYIHTCLQKYCLQRSSNLSIRTKRYNNKSNNMIPHSSNNNNSLKQDNITQKCRWHIVEKAAQYKQKNKLLERHFLTSISNALHRGWKLTMTKWGIRRYLVQWFFLLFFSYFFPSEWCFLFILHPVLDARILDDRYTDFLFQVCCIGSETERTHAKPSLRVTKHSKKAGVCLRTH